jgi:hypothetical protein
MSSAVPFLVEASRLYGTIPPGRGAALTAGVFGRILARPTRKNPMNTRFGFVAAAVGLIVTAWASAADVPIDNPTKAYQLAWTDEIRWGAVVPVGDAAGKDWDEKTAAAQQAVVEKGGGVVYFPAGVYEFQETIRLRGGVVLRGATPAGQTDARETDYNPPTRFHFPRYRPAFEGEGTPVRTAFKGIELSEPAGVSRCGVVHIAMDNAHVRLADEDYSKNFTEGKSGRDRIVFGCVLTNAAVLDPSIPKLKDDLGRPFQDAWQRWTHRHHAAIHIVAGGNVLVGNCRIPESGQSNFVMPGYKLHPATKEGEYRKRLESLKVVTHDVPFDYDNRGGIFVNSLGACRALNIWNVFGAPGNTDVNIDPAVAAEARAEAAQDPAKARPWAFARGIVIRNNNVVCSGAGAIKFCGDGAVCSFNVIRYKPKVVRPTARGYQFDSFTNNNRAAEMRGYRWTVEGNDYEVHSNLSIQGNPYGDGEGLMHEAWDNCDIRDSKLLNNKGNRYLCIWRVPVDGLEIRGNSTGGGINVLGCTNLRAPLPVKNVRIIGNTTIDSGINLTGRPAENNLVKDNTYQGAPGKNKLVNESLAVLENNTGYDETTRDPPAPKLPPAPPAKKTAP